MSNIYQFIVLLPLLLWISKASSQHQISGKITGINGNPLELVTVELFVLPDSSWQEAILSDSLGNFHLQDIPQGTYFLQLIAWVINPIKPLPLTY